MERLDGEEIAFHMRHSTSHRSPDQCALCNKDIEKVCSRPFSSNGDELATHDYPAQKTSAEEYRLLRKVNVCHGQGGKAWNAC